MTDREAAERYVRIWLDLVAQVVGAELSMGAGCAEGMAEVCEAIDLAAYGLGSMRNAARHLVEAFSVPGVPRHPDHKLAAQMLDHHWDRHGFAIGERIDPTRIPTDAELYDLIRNVHERLRSGPFRKEATGYEWLAMARAEYGD